MNLNPILVESTRGDMVENIHRGSIAISDSSGKILAAWGDIDLPRYVRSTVKLMQTVSLVESGAVEHFGLTSKEIALSCASHSGETFHTQGVAEWLNTLGLDQNALKCGNHRPLNSSTYKQILRHGEEISPLHNPCSGKHASFLTQTIFGDEPIEEYNLLESPVQQRCLKVTEDIMQADSSYYPKALDGCNVPAISFTLKDLAYGMARFNPRAVGFTKKRRLAMQRVLEALREKPEMISGTGKFDTEVIRITSGEIFTKVGSDGMYVATLPEKGIGIALKIDDGNLGAATVAMGTILSHYIKLTPPQLARLLPFIEPVQKNQMGIDTGVMKASLHWLSL